MFGIKRNWIVTFFVAALCLGLLGIGFLLMPRQPPLLAIGEPQSFRFMPDPHLFLQVDEVSLGEAIGGSSLGVTLSASNTAGGDMTIDLRRLRVALVTADGETLDPVVPFWSGDASTLQARNSSTSVLTIPVPEGAEPAAVLIWEGNAFSRFLASARGSILCPTLKLNLDEPGVAEPMP